MFKFHAVASIICGIISDLICDFFCCFYVYTLLRLSKGTVTYEPRIRRQEGEEPLGATEDPGWLTLGEKEVVIEVVA